MNRAQILIRKRDTECLLRARSMLNSIGSDLDARGLKYQAFGSITRDDFKAGSDVDLMVFGDLPYETRIEVERLIDGHVERSGISCDLLFAMDLSKENVEMLLGY